MLQPAIELADQGFAAAPRYVTSPNCAGTTNLTGRAKHSPLAAETFKLLAQHGADCFHKVDLAKGCNIALGYTVGIGDVGSVQAVLVDPHTGKQYGAADNRREGTVIGLPRPQGR